jgi:hypothetical protein
MSYARRLIVLAGLTVAPAAAQPCAPGVAQTLVLDAHHEFAHAGRSVAITAGALAVGVYNDNRLGVGAGSVAVYAPDPATWQLDQELFPPRPTVGGWFGYAVAADTDRIVVGAPFTVISGQAVGSAHVFRRDAVLGWVAEGELLAPVRSPDDRFGHSVAIAGDTAVVGVPRDDRPGFADSGSVMVFEFSDGEWSHTQTLFPPSTATAEAGWSVAFDGETIVIGAPYDDADELNAGSAFAYARNDGVWTLAANLGLNANRRDTAFGWTVAVDGDRLLIGAPDFPIWNSQARGYVFHYQHDGTDWGHPGQIGEFELDPDNRFGTSVALAGDRVVVGDAGSGRAWLAELGPFGSWEMPVALVPDAEPLRFYGVSAALTDTHAVIGADRLAGAAYAFGLACACPADFNADGLLNFFDLAAYLGAFAAGDPVTDLAPPSGVFNFFDVAAYIALYNAGCP